MSSFVSSFISSNRSKVFDGSTEEFDQSTYLGRLLRTIVLMDPRLMFYSSSRINESRSILLNKSEHSNLSIDSLWHHKRVVDGCCRPDGTPVNPLFRTSSFLATNIPICAGMLFAAPTFFNTVFFQWMNQTYNALFNISNSNSTPEVDRFAKSYFAACSVSVGLALGLNELLKRSKLSPRVRSIGSIVVPFTAVASASVCNVLLMRSDELIKGVAVEKEEGDVLGKSKEAAKQVLGQVALTRIALPFPILVMPPVLLGLIKAVYRKPLSTTGNKLLELSVLSGCLSVAFPGAMSLFGPRIHLNKEKLEPEFKSYSGNLFASRGV